MDTHWVCSHGHVAHHPRPVRGVDCQVMVQLGPGVKGVTWCRGNLVGPASPAQAAAYELGGQYAVLALGAP